MRILLRLAIVCAFWALSALSVPACSTDNDVRDNLADYYTVTLSAVENTCPDNGGGGPTSGTQLPVSVDATSSTTFNFTLGAGTDHPLTVPGVEVDADGAFDAEIVLQMNGPDDPPGVLDLTGSVTPDELDADLLFRIGTEDENGMFVEYCHIAASLTGPPCGRACDSLN